MSLQRCKKETTSTEFVLWKVRMEADVNDFHREDYFFAQLACLVARANMGEKGNDVSIKDFLLKFSTPKAEPAPKELAPEEREQKMAESKAAWGAALGMVLG